MEILKRLFVFMPCTTQYGEDMVLYLKDLIGT